MSGPFDAGTRRQLKRLGVRPRDAARAAEHVHALFDAVSHVHGVPKSALPAVQMAAALLDAWREAPSARVRAALLDAFGLPAACRCLLQRTLDCAGVRGGAAGSAVRDQVALRAAALVRLAAVCGGAGCVEFVRERQAGLEVVTTCDARRISGVRDAVALWARAMPRPIDRVRTRRDGERAPALTPPGLAWRAAARRVLARQCAYLACRVYGLAQREDPEFVHELRIVTRRMRVALRIFRRVFGRRYAATRDELAALSDVLGAARDTDVFLAFIQGRRAGAAPALGALLDAMAREARRPHARQYATARERLECGLLRQLARDIARLGRRGPGGGRVGGEVPAILRQRVRAVWRHRGPLGAMAPEELHRLRIACKRLRYACEFFQDAYPRRLRRVVEALVRLQGLLGSIHDGDVFAGRVRACVGRVRIVGRRRAAQRLLRDLAADRRALMDEAQREWLKFAGAKGCRRVARILDRPRSDETH